MKGETGSSLIEVVISLALVGIIAVAFLSGLGTSSTSALTTDQRETAKNLAETAMEDVKSQTYASSYSYTPTADYGDYTANIIVGWPYTGDTDIQKITVIVEDNGKELAKLEDYKVR